MQPCYGYHGCAECSSSWLSSINTQAAWGAFSVALHACAEVWIVYYLISVEQAVSASGSVAGYQSVTAGCSVTVLMKDCQHVISLCILLLCRQLRKDFPQNKLEPVCLKPAEGQ